jgi:hypothetical protein
MSRIHYIDSHVGEDGNGRVQLACASTTKLEVTAGTRVTNVPAKTTCGACHVHLRKRYRELTDGQNTDQRAVAKAWWQYGE